MSRHDGDRLDDIASALGAIRAHVERGPLSDGLQSAVDRMGLLLPPDADLDDGSDDPRSGD